MVNGIIAILPNCNIFVILLFGTIPPFLSRFCIGTVEFLVSTATQKPDEKNIYRESHMKKVSTVMNVGSRKRNSFSTVARKLVLNNMVEIYHYFDHL